MIRSAHAPGRSPRPRRDDVRVGDQDHLRRQVEPQQQRDQRGERRQQRVVRRAPDEQARQLLQHAESDGAEQRPAPRACARSGSHAREPRTRGRPRPASRTKTTTIENAVSRSRRSDRRGRMPNQSRARVDERRAEEGGARRCAGSRRRSRWRAAGCAGSPRSRRCRRASPSASVRSATRSDPIAPIAAPIRPTSDRMPARFSPAGAWMSDGSIRPSSPSSPGIAASTAVDQRLPRDRVVGQPERGEREARAARPRRRENRVR